MFLHFLFITSLFGFAAAEVTTISSTKHKPCPDVEKLRILPGFGWDGLTNNDTKQMMKWTYHQCKLTSDGKFLIPDNTVAVAVEIEKKQIEAEIFENWSNYTALSSAGFKVATDIWPEQFLPLYFSFSDEYQRMKSLQVKNETFTCRSQIRRVIYRVKSTSDATMNAAVEEKFQQVITALVKNDTRLARVLTEMIVSDYGTHYTKSVDVGMVYAMEHHLKNDFLTKHVDDKSKILSASKLSLLEYDTSFSLEDQQHLDSSLLSEYKEATLTKKNRFSSGLNWDEDATSECLAAIDRSGDVLTSLVTSSKFPETSSEILINAREIIDEVIKEYYTRNIHRGCTDPNSSNFDYIANLDDGSCKSSKSTGPSYVFGGAYAVYKHYPNIKTNDRLSIKNPLTDTYSCPTNFEPQVFYSVHQYYEASNYYVWSLVSCLSLANNSVGPSYMFGGFFNAYANNIHTKKKSCPEFYTALDLSLEGWKICVSSSDNDLAKQYALPFGGFATVDTEFQCPSGYKRHLAAPFGVRMIVSGPKVDRTNYGKTYYCLQEESVKNMDVVPSLNRFPEAI